MYSSRDSRCVHQVCKFVKMLFLKWQNVLKRSKENIQKEAVLGPFFKKRSEWVNKAKEERSLMMNGKI